MRIVIEEIGTNAIEQCHPGAEILSLMKTGAALDPGDPVPAGRCGTCALLVYPIVSGDDKLANSRRIAASNADIAVDALGKLAVAQEAIDALAVAHQANKKRIENVEGVCERWFVRMTELGTDLTKQSIVNSYQDNRTEILAALGGEQK